MTILPRRGATAVLAAGLAFTAAACGSSGNSPTSSLTPPKELSVGAGALLSGSALSGSFQLAISATTLQDLSARTGGSAVPTAIAQLVTGGSIQFAVRTTNGATLASLAKSGNSTQALGNEDLSFSVNAGGSPLVQVEIVGGDLYARAAVQQILTLAHVSPSKLAFLNNPALPPSLNFLHAAAAGDWLQLPLTGLTQLLHQVAPSAASSSTTSQLRQMLNQIFSQDLTVTRVGSSSLGDHLVVTGSAQTVLSGFLGALKSTVPSNPVFNKLNPSNIPNRTVTVDAYVKGGVLHELSLDLIQFAPASQQAKLAGQTAPITLTLSQSAPSITAPSSYTTVNIASILSGLLGAAGAAAGSSSVSSSGSGSG
ncbi:MAG: hypothetical protein ACYDAQ_04775 [Mycobacteriales bacterium]